MDALSDPILGSMCASAVVVFSIVPVCVGPPGTEKKIQMAAPGTEEKKNQIRTGTSWIG